MREIKFRAWYNDKFHYNIEKHHVEHHSLSGWSGDVWDFSDWLKYSTVQQFTGMKTKSGKDIYEGDILAEKHNGGEGEANIGQVYFAAGTFMINGDGALYEHTYSLTPDILEDYEVVGNIFETPELLKL